MERVEERSVAAGGWNIRSIYESLDPPDLLEAEAFYMAFAKPHNLDGHIIPCIFTKAKHNSVSLANYGEGLVTQNISVLIARDSDLVDVRANSSLRVDGVFYTVNQVSNPSGDIVRIELAGGE